MVTTNSGQVKELQKHPSANAFHWVALETELRAWVENPSAHLAGEPVYLLCEITNANAQTQRAEVRPIDSACGYWVSYSLIHCVHTYVPLHNKVIKIHGEIGDL